MSATGDEAAGSSYKEINGNLNEKLRSMKRTRGGYLANVTKLEGELESFTLSSSQYESACKKKQELDDAMLRCTDYCKAYVAAIPDEENFKDMKIEALNKCTELQDRKLKSEAKFETYVQVCTDHEGSASVAGENSVASMRSSKSSIRRQREVVELRRVQAELEARLRFQQAEREEQMKLDDERLKQAEKRAKQMLEEQRIKFEIELSKAKFIAAEANSKLDDGQSVISRKNSPSKQSIITPKPYNVAVNDLFVQPDASLVRAAPNSATSHPRLNKPPLSNAAPPFVAFSPSIRPSNFNGGLPYNRNPVPSFPLNVPMQTTRTTFNAAPQRMEAPSVLPTGVPFGAVDTKMDSAQTRVSSMGPASQPEHTNSTDSNLVAAESFKRLSSVIQQSFSLPKRNLPSLTAIRLNTMAL